MTERADLVELEQRIQRGLYTQALAHVPGQRVALESAPTPPRSSSWRPLLVGLSAMCAVRLAVGAWACSRDRVTLRSWHRRR